MLKNSCGSRTYPIRRAPVACGDSRSHTQVDNGVSYRFRAAAFNFALDDRKSLGQQTARPMSINEICLIFPVDVVKSTRRGHQGGNPQNRCWTTPMAQVPTGRFLISRGLLGFGSNHSSDLPTKTAFTVKTV